MTNEQIAKKQAKLVEQAQAAHNRYSRARGARRNKGGRIESAAESKARMNRDAKITALHNFEQEHTLTAVNIDY